MRKMTGVNGKRAGISLILSLILGCASATSSGTGTYSPTFDVSKTYTVAVIPLEKSQYVKEKDLQALYDMLAMGLLKAGLFKVVERQRIKDVLKEQQFQYSGLVDENTAVEFGKLLGADVVAMYDILTARMREDGFGRAYMLEIVVKLVDTKTGEIIYFGRGTGYGATKGEAMENAVKGALKSLYEMTGKKKK